MIRIKEDKTQGHQRSTHPRTHKYIHMHIHTEEAEEAQEAM